MIRSLVRGVVMVEGDMSIWTDDPESLTLRGRSRIVFRDTAGGNSPQAALTDDEARWIYRSARAGVPRDSLAAMLGVTQAVVYGVVSGRKYSRATRGV